MIRVCFKSKEVEQVSLSLQLSTVQEERLERDFNMTAALRKKLDLSIKNLSSFNM